MPTNEDWTLLINFLGGLDVAGGKLKDTDFWMPPNTGATNSSGFYAQSAGTRDYVTGSFYNAYYSGYWWTSTTASTVSAYYRYLRYNSSKSFSGTASYHNGYSVRCIYNSTFDDYL